MTWTASATPARPPSRVPALTLATWPSILPATITALPSWTAVTSQKTTMPSRTATVAPSRTTTTTASPTQPTSARAPTNRLAETGPRRRLHRPHRRYYRGRRTLWRDPDAQQRPLRPRPQRLHRRHRRYCPDSQPLRAALRATELIRMARLAAHTYLKSSISVHQNRLLS